MSMVASVFPGDVLSGTATVIEARPMNSKPHVGLARMRYETRKQDGIIVLTMQGWTMLRRRDALA